MGIVTKIGSWLFVRLITDTVKNTPLAFDDKVRLQHFTILVFFGMPIMIGFAVYNFIGERLLPTSLLFLSSTGVFFGWILLCYLPLGKIIYRFNAVLFGGMLLYMMLLGGDHGSKALWMFVFPQIIILLLGRTEGIAWSGGLLVIGLGLILTNVPGFASYQYGNEYLIRFITVYLVVTAITYWFDYFREHSQAQLEAALQRAEQAVAIPPSAEPGERNDRDDKPDSL